MHLPSACVVEDNISTDIYLNLYNFFPLFFFNWREFQREEHKEFDTVLRMHSTILLKGSSTMSLSPTVSRVWGYRGSDILTLSAHPFLLVPNNILVRL